MTLIPCSYVESKCFLKTKLSQTGNVQEQVKKSATEMTKLDQKGATDRLVSMRGVDIVGANNNNIQEGKKLFKSLPSGMFICDNFWVVVFKSKHCL